MDWVIHISDEGKMESSMSSAEFFSDENQKNIEILEENIQKDGLKIDDDWSPVDKPHEFKPDK